MSVRELMIGKSKEEIFKILKQNEIEPYLLQLLIKDDEAYQIVTDFLTSCKSDTQIKVAFLNSFAQKIKSDTKSYETF